MNTLQEDLGYFLWMRDLFPKASPRLQRLLAGALDAAGLPLADLYQLKDWLEGLDPKKADSLAFLLVALFLALAEGSLCVELTVSGLMNRLGDLLDEREAKRWAEQALRDFHEGAFAFLVGQSTTDAKPVIEWEGERGSFLYFQKYLRGELEFQHHFLEHLLRQPADVPIGELKPILKEVLVDKPLRVGDRPLQLDRDQSVALGLALSRNFVLISGGPGTGKTSIVLNLLRCLVRCGYPASSISLAAPTGRAAQRLSDSLRAGLENLASDETSLDRSLQDLSASTLHSLLGYNPSRQTFRHHGENHLPAEVVIIDEVSMVGVVLMSQLFQSLAPGTKLILLGDKDQLPSVDAGAVLSQMVQNLDEPIYSQAMRRRLGELFPGLEFSPMVQGTRLEDAVVYLRTNHRSQAGIRELAQAVNRQDQAILEKFPVMDMDTPLADLEQTGGCFFWKQVSQSAGEIQHMVERWAHHTYLFAREGEKSFRDVLVRFDGSLENPDPAGLLALQDLFRRFERTRLLTLIREGAWGCDEINLHLEQWLRWRMDRFSRIGLFPGAPVLITRNDPSRQLFNGDMGLTLEGREGMRVVFARQGSFLSYPVEGLPAWEWGFAMTVHKSQGSEFGQVMLVLPPRGGRRLLTKELVYTGITRAKKLAVLCGSEDALRMAVGRKIVRESGLAWQA